MQITPTNRKLAEYAQIMKDSATLSRVQSLAPGAAQAVNLEDTREKIAALTDMVATGRGLEVWTMDDAFRNFMESQAAEKNGNTSATASGRSTKAHTWSAWRCGGHRRRALGGKTALALVLASTTWPKKKYRWGFSPGDRPPGS